MAKPCTRDLMMFMVFPKESHEHVHVEQKSHALKASMSLTSWEVIVPFVVRITGKPSSPVEIVKGSTFISRYHDKHLRVIRKMDRFRELDLTVLDGPFIGRGLHGCYFTPRPKSNRPLPSGRAVEKRRLANNLATVIELCTHKSFTINYIIMAEEEGFVGPLRSDSM